MERNWIYDDQVIYDGCYIVYEYLHHEGAEDCVNTDIK
jgi:hypothetical protein